MKVGQTCMKIAGRDAGSYCVIVEKLDNNFVLIDGNTRRRKCNLKHLEILDTTLDVKEGSTTAHVRKVLKDAGFPVHERKKGTKERKKTEKPVKTRKSLQKALEKAKNKAEKSKQKEDKKAKTKKAAEKKEAKK